MKKLSFRTYLFFLLAGLIWSGCNPSSLGGARGWDQLPAILDQIEAPTFPDRDFSVLDYGAPKGDSLANCLPAIAKAIDECNKAGGGRVVIPRGTWLVKGPIHLKSKVNLHLEEGATVKFSTNPTDYLPLVLTRYEGIELMNYSPLIYAYQQKNIAVTGKGTFNGQADNNHWWNWVKAKRFGWKEGMPSQSDSANRPELSRMAAKGIPVEDRKFGKGHYLRPSFLEVYDCENVLIEGITIRNTPFWILHPTLSKNVTIDGVTTISYGPNNDGCDPESCDGVLIKNCLFNTGDDCIAIKSGRDEDGRRINVPAKNIIIEDCEMKDGHGGVVIGSETSGGVENIFARNCQMSSPNLDRAIRIKSNSFRGGVLKNFYFKDIEVGEVRESVIRINMFYWDENGNYPPTLDSVFIDHVTSQKSEYAINIEGRKDKPVSNIFISNCDFNNVEKDNVIKEATNVKITNTIIDGRKVTLNE